MATKLHLDIPKLGKLFRYADNSSDGLPVEWTPSNFSDLPLEYSVLGDTERPFFESAGKILTITGQRNLIETAIRQYLSRTQFAFHKHMLTFELDHVCFDDATSSDRYIATCISEFEEDSPEFPPTPCAGNGFWDLKFRLNRLDVVDFMRDDALYL